MPTRSAPRIRPRNRSRAARSRQFFIARSLELPMTPSTSSVAVLGGGCFWCLDAVFRGLAGVIGVESGYAGGEDPHPTYEAVCTRGARHAPSVKNTLAPQVLTLPHLLTPFFSIYHPTPRAPPGDNARAQ